MRDYLMMTNPMTGKPMRDYLMITDPMIGKPILTNPMRDYPMIGKLMTGKLMISKLMITNPMIGKPGYLSHLIDTEIRLLFLCLLPLLRLATSVVFNNFSFHYCFWFWWNQFVDHCIPIMPNNLTIGVRLKPINEIISARIFFLI